MAEYINKEEAYRILNSLYNDLDNLDEEEPELWVDGFIGIAIGKIEDMPAADVAPVVHGHWIICSDGYYPYCSVCKCEPKGREMTKFCGECGAKMDKEE